MKDTQITIQNNALPKTPNVGDIIEGKIISKTGSAAYLDLVGFGTGIIYGREFLEAKAFLKEKNIGEKLFTKIVDLDNEEGYIELSLKQASKEMGWEILKQKKENNETMVVKISAANKGGLLTEISGIPAFLPVSQLSHQNYPRVEGADKSKILRELQKFIGKEMKIKLFDINREENKLILSEKAEEISRVKAALTNYKVGDIVEGEISGIVDFGAFIKFRKPADVSEGKSTLPGCHPGKISEDLPPADGPAKIDTQPPMTLEGLCHISELDWQLVNNPLQIVRVGEKVKAKITEISDNRIFLSLKALKQDPWKTAEEKYKKGDNIEGKIIKFNPFGAFVEVSEKIYGLVHISEFGTKAKMEEKLKIDQKHNFQISEINAPQHRMILKLKEAEQKESV